jgi:hypothetical protein
MKNRIEDELRELFGDSASGFDMDGSLPPQVVRRGRRRAWRATSAVAAVAVVLATASVLALRTQHPGSAGGTVATHTGVLKLVDYASPNTGDSPDDPTFQSAFQQHVQCMRDHGFDVPDPVQTDHGWEIIMSPGSDPLSDPRWREAALVTCSLEKFENRPLTGDLVMGFSAAKIAEFISCMRTQGYDLPQPEQSSDGEYRWPLQGLGIDTRTDEWNRAVFMACSPTGD